MDYKQREEAARQIAASVREALGRIMADRNAGHQIVRDVRDAGNDVEGPESSPKH